jgi:hypothetical protein
MKKIMGVIKYLVFPSWRRDYKLNQMLRKGIPALDAMTRLGIVA